MTDSPQPEATQSSPSSSGNGSSPPSAPAVTGSGPSSTTPSTPPPSAAPVSEVAATRPEWLPEEFWDDKGKAINGKGLREQFDSLRAWKAAEDIKAATRPTDPNGYKTELPADWKPPEGIDFKFREDDPLLIHAKQWAQSAGLTQDQFAQALGIYAAAQVGMNQQIQQAREAEIQKLGPNAGNRVDSVLTWLKAQVGEESAKHLSTMMVTANMVSAFEKLVVRFANQGVGTYNRSGQDMASRSISDEDWGKMSYHEKAEYQRQFAARNGR